MAMMDLAPSAGMEASLALRRAKLFQLLLLTLTGGAAIYASSSLYPLQEAMRTSLALSDNQVALLQGPAMALPIVFLVIPFGFIIDRYSRVRLLMACAVCNLAGGVLTALASSLALLFLARCLVGVAVATMLIASYSLLADHYEPAQRGRAKAVLVVGQYAGKSAAFAVGGLLMGMFATQADGWRTAMLWLCAPLVAVILALSIMREPARSESVVVRPSLPASLVALYSYRQAVAPLLIGVVLVDFPLRAVMTWAAPTFARNFGLPPQRVGAIMATVLVVSGLLGPVAGGVVADLCHHAGRPRRTLFVLSGLALLCVPGCLFAVATGVTSAGVLLIVLMTSMSATMAMGMTLLTIVVPNELRGVCLSLLTVTNVIFAGALAPVAVSLLAGALGGEAMLGRALTVTCSIASVLGAATFALGGRHFQTLRQREGAA